MKIGKNYSNETSNYNSILIQKEEKMTEKQEKERAEDKDNAERLFSIIYAVFSSQVRSDLQLILAMITWGEFGYCAQ